MRRLVRLVPLALPVALAACGGGGVTPPDGTVVDFDRRALLRNLGEQVVLPTLVAFDAEVEALAAAVGATCPALGTPDEADRRAEAQAAWKTAMTRWQEAELMRFGPVAMDGGVLHDRIYSWPITSSCAVDQDVMLRWNDPAAYDISTRLTNRRGLAALEYLLFAPTLETTCPPQAAPAGWDTLAELDRKKARCGFAEVAAADLATQAQTLVDAWAPDRGNYVGVLAAAGTSGSPFASAHEAVNVVSNALFYVDSDTKDMKLAEPAGIILNSCGTIGEPCLAELESPWAPHSKENIAANLRGFRMMFTGDRVDGGAGGLGFDDFLVSANAADLAALLTSETDAAIAKVEAIPGPLGEAVTSAPQAVAAAHTAVKAVTDQLKSRFLTVLALELPMEIGDDTD